MHKLVEIEKYENDETCELPDNDNTSDILSGSYFLSCVMHFKKNTINFP